MFKMIGVLVVLALGIVIGLQFSDFGSEVRLSPNDGGYETEEAGFFDFIFGPGEDPLSFPDCLGDGTETETVYGEITTNNFGTGTHCSADQPELNCVCNDPLEMKKPSTLVGSIGQSCSKSVTCSGNNLPTYVAPSDLSEVKFVCVEAAGNADPSNDDGIDHCKGLGESACIGAGVGCNWEPA
jgi:hypothetical protein